MNAYRTALITGASSGIGYGLARALAARGTRVYVAARRQAQLDALCAEIAAAGGRAEALPLDVGDADHTYETVRALDARDPLDLVIANAGVGKQTPSKHLDWAQVKQILDVNVLGALATLAAALPGMLARDEGHLCGVASVAGIRGLPKYSAYCASKAALISFLESTRLDLAKTSVSVTTVCPGYVRTEMTTGVKSPFMVELDRAVATILGSLDRRDSQCTFPAAIAIPMRTLPFLPNSMYDFLLTRAKI